MTLTEVSYYFRKIVPITFISLIFFSLSYLFLKLILPSILTPPKKPSIIINPLFGKLSQIKFSQSFNYPSDIDFVLDNIEGEPITATQTAKVYYLTSKVPRFGYLQKIYLMAKNLGFDTTMIKHKLDGKNAIFQDDEKKFIVDISNFNFEYQYNYENNKELFENTIIPDENLIKEKAKEFLRVLGRYPDELAKGKENIILLNYNSSTNEFQIIKPEEQANVIEVDFYRSDVEGFPIVTSKYFNSQNFVVAVFKENDYKVLKAQVKFFEKEEEKVAVYPLKTGDQAWQELKEKKGTIVSLGEKNNQIIIKKMFLGYYDPDSYQEYLQPVYVFLGEKGFVGYVPAIKEEYIK